jgi:hypothetical protein
MKNVILVLAMVSFLMVGCAAFKKVVRTVNDIATDLCWIAAADHPDQLGGLTPAAWCAIKENIDPFINHVLQAKQDHDGKLGLNPNAEE